MKHISTTPFGRRPVAAGHLAHVALADAPCPALPLDKWAVMRDLTIARRAFSVSDRDLHVLHALLTFLPAAVLSADAPTIVFPSNARLAERLHGMPESTLRRHIAALIAAGLILRHDSPNGKRFARRDTTGEIARAFGFDLLPLLVRSCEITSAAEVARQEVIELKELREEAILHLRDAAQLLPTEHLAELQKMLRRKLDLDAMRDLAMKAATFAAAARANLPEQTPIPSGNDAQIERHIQDSNKTLSDSESCLEPTLQAVLAACPESQTYAQTPIVDWNRLIDTAQRVVPMMGIAAEVWHHARQAMGAVDAATTVLCILQRFDRIAKPGAYLRSLAAKARAGDYSSGQMVRALLAAQS